MGVLTVDDGDIDVDLDALADAINDVDAYTQAWTDYERNTDDPGDDRYDAWVASGPKATPRAQPFLVMSRTEQGRLRLLATLADDRVHFRVDDLWGLDPAAQRFVDDWWTVVQVVM